MELIVTNFQGLNVRTQPNAQRNDIITRTLSCGEIVTAFDVFDNGAKTYARICEQTTGKQEYILVRDGKTIYAAPRGMTSLSWAQEIDTWARTKGYQGRKP